MTQCLQVSCGRSHLVWTQSYFHWTPHFAILVTGLVFCWNWWSWKTVRSNPLVLQGSWVWGGSAVCSVSVEVYQALDVSHLCSPQYHSSWIPKLSWNTLGSKNRTNLTKINQTVGKDPERYLCLTILLNCLSCEVTASVISAHGGSFESCIFLEELNLSSQHWPKTCQKSSCSPGVELIAPLHGHVVQRNLGRRNAQPKVCARFLCMLCCFHGVWNGGHWTQHCGIC